MKKLILMLALALGVFFSSSAQKIPTAEELAKKNVEEIDKRLKLTPTQKGVKMCIRDRNYLHLLPQWRLA